MSASWVNPCHSAALQRITEPEHRAAHVLSQAEAYICDAIKAGESCDLSQLPKASSNVRGYVLRDIISSPPRRADNRRSSLLLIAARVLGDLDLSDAEVTTTCMFVNCEFTGTIDIQRTQIRSVEIYGGLAPRILARSLRSEFDLVIRGIRCDRIDLTGAELRGIDLGGSVLSNPLGQTILADKVLIEGDFAAGERFISRGQVQMRHARIQGQLFLDGAEIAGSKGLALDATGLRAGQGVSMGNGFRAFGEVRLIDSEIVGVTSFSGGKFSNPGADCVDVSGCSISRSLNATSGFESIGEFKLLATEIGGQLVLENAKLKNLDRDALSADGAVVKGGIFANEGFEADGTVRFVGSSIDGPVSFNGAKLNNPRGFTLNAAHARIGGALVLSRGFVSNGRIDLSAGEVSGSVQLDGARLRNADGISLCADGVRVGSSLNARNGFSSVGEMRLTSAHIGGQLSLASASLSNLTGSSFSADRMVVDGTWFAGEGLSSSGEFRAVGAQVRGQCIFDGGTFSNPSAPALALDGATVRANLSLCDGFESDGEVRLPGVEVGGQFSIQGGAFRNADKSAFAAEKMSVSGIAFLAQFTFEGVLNFSVSQFDTSMVVAEASGKGRFDFSECRFRGTTTLNFELEQRETVSLNGARFEAATTVQISGESDVPRGELAKLSGSGIQAVSSISIGGDWFQADLDGARFMQVSSLFSAAESAHAESGAVALESIKGCSLVNLEMNGLDLSQCEFATAYDIDGVRLTGNNHFLRSPDDDGPRDVLYDEVLLRAHSSDGESWAAMLNDRKSESAAQEAIGVEAAYRSIRHALECSGNAPGANEFYFGEMEMRRIGSHTPRSTKLLITLYKFVCGYATRPLDAATVMWFLFALSIAAWAAKFVAPSSASCLTPGGSNSFSNLVANFGLLPSQLAGYLDEPNACSIATLALTVLGIAFAITAVLFVVAIRSRVKR